MNNSYKQHWENVFTTKTEKEVSWFQPYPKTSIELVELFNLPLNANIINIGGGNSHFAEDKIYKYVSIAEDAIKKESFSILGTFSENGPKQCTGLKIRQYSEASMSARFEIAFERIKCVQEDHITPFNTVQNFLFCSFKKK